MKRRVYICPIRLGALAREGLTDGEIAAELGCTPSGVSNARKLHGIASHPRGRRAGRDYGKRGSAATCDPALGAAAGRHKETEHSR